MIRAAPALFGALFVAGLVGGLVACSGENAGPDGPTPAVKLREAVRVRTSPVEQREMVRTISTTTTVESEREIRLVPRAAGVVMRLDAEEGDRVVAGEVLAELDRRASQAAITEARIALREAEDLARKAQLSLPEAENRIATAKLKWEQGQREYERNEKAGLISAQALDNLRVARDMAQSEHDGAKLAFHRAEHEVATHETLKGKAEVALQRAELQDSYMILTAPFDGVIAQRFLKVGDSAGPSAAAFVLTDPTALRAIVHRPQRELSMFFAAQRRGGDGNGLEIRAVAEALPDKKFPGEIQLVSPSIDPQSGSFRVTVRLPPAAQGEAGLLPGMLVRLEIVTERHPDALAVPKRALRREGGSDFVFVVDAGKSRRVEVKEGFSDDASTEVEPLNGATLVAGMRVIVIGNREIEDGADVLEEAAAGVPIAPPAEPAASETPAQDTTASSTKG